MKISTKFNLLVGLFFFFVIIAVLYSYCGGLSVCYSFPFFNGMDRGSVTKANLMMTSYIIDEKDAESRDHATIYFYSKTKHNSNRLQKTTRKPGNEEDTTRKKTGSSSHDPPSDITGKIAERILKKANISLEESNRELFREEKVDKKVDREDSIQIKTKPTQTTPVTKDRGDLGTRVIPPRVHPIRRPPRKLRKRLKMKRVNRLTEQDRINRALERKLERKEELLRMREGRVNNLSSSREQRQSRGQIKNRIKDFHKITVNQSKMEKDHANEAVNPLEKITSKMHRNEALNDTKVQENEAKHKNRILSPNNRKRHNNTSEHSADQSKTKQNKKRNNKKRGKMYQSEKIPLREKTKAIIPGQKYEFQKVKKENAFVEIVASGSHDDEMTSSGMVPLKRLNKALKAKSVNDGSGSGESSRLGRYSTLSAVNLIRSIRNIKDVNTKNALQSALNKDEQQLQYEVMKIKNNYNEQHRSFNLSNVLRELVRAAESDEGTTTENFTRNNQGIVMRRRSNDKALVRVKRLRNNRMGNTASELTLVRVKRIEDDTPRDSNTVSDRQLVRVKRLDNLDDENMHEIPKLNIQNTAYGQTQIQLKTAGKLKVKKEEKMLKKQIRLNDVSNYEKLKYIEKNKRQNRTMSTLEETVKFGKKDLNQSYNRLRKENKTNESVNTSKKVRNVHPRSDVELVRVKRLDLDDE